MQAKKIVSLEDRRQAAQLCDFLLGVQSVHCERIEATKLYHTQFLLAFTFNGETPSPISLAALRRMWVQILLEPLYPLLAVPISWNAREDILIVSPRRDREDLNVYANFAIEHGGKPQIVKLGAAGKSLFRTFNVSLAH